MTSRDPAHELIVGGGERLSYAETRARARRLAKGLRRLGVRRKDLANLRYTSGTTSPPKGVQLAHGGLVENMWNIGERQHLTSADRLWMGISLFWSFGCANALLAVMTHGGTIVLQDALEAGAALALIERERCTVYYGTPNIALALTEHPDRARRDLASLRTGAAIGPPAALRT